MRESASPRARAALVLCALCAAVLLCAALTGCRPQLRRYALKGKVLSVDAPQKQIVVDHDEIPGFMPAMTMPYPVHDIRLLDNVGPGDQITADVVVSADDAWLENIAMVKKGEAAPSSPAGDFHQPQPGEMAPDFALVNQDGKKIHLREYRGKALLLTFIYTRCPLPDYCPLMSRNFAAIEEALAKNPELYAKTHLLSISFDSRHDTPAVLRSYGQWYLPEKGKHDFDHWEFASAPPEEMKKIAKFFGLYYKGAEGQIVHSMSTAVLSPDGKIYRWYHGNDWQTADVLKDVTESASGMASNSTR